MFSTSHRSPAVSLFVLLLTVLLLTQTVAAQFEGMFNNMFGQQQQQQRGGPERSTHGVRGWDLQNAASCWNGHVCSGTANCVVSPKDCPCPYPEDHKCFLPDSPKSIMSKLHLGAGGVSSNAGSYVCIRAKEGRSAESECERVRRMGGAI